MAILVVLVNQVLAFQFQNILRMNITERNTGVSGNHDVTGMCGVLPLKDMVHGTDNVPLPVIVEVYFWLVEQDERFNFTKQQE